jgi:hypothetical protein
VPVVAVDVVQFEKRHSNPSSPYRGRLL